MDGIQEIISQVGQLTAQVGILQNELRDHQHNGTIYSQTNDGDLLHTTRAYSISPTTTAATFNPSASEVFTITPTGNITLTVGSSNVPSGVIIAIVIKTSGTTSYTITFGTGFTATATLSTGTLDGRYFTIAFACDGVNLREISRTAAMLPS